MIRIRLVVHNLNFTVTVLDSTLNTAMHNYTQKYITREYVTGTDPGKYETTTKYYFSYIKRSDYYRFSINSLRDFISTLGYLNVKREEIQIFYDKNYEVASLDLKIKDGYIPRDYQEKFNDALINSKAPTNLVDLFTGYGKTFIAIYSIVQINMRLMVLIIPRYIDKWIADFKKYTDIKDEDFYIIQGSESYEALMKMDNIPYKIIINSMRTSYNYIKDYEEMDDFNYPVDPQDLIKHLKVGLILNDESHQEFDALFKACLYYDAKRLLGLSATFKSHQASVNRMYNALFPESSRISGLVAYVKYIDVVSVKYYIGNLSGIRYKRPQGYSQILYEQTIMRNSVVLKNYLEMILYYVEFEYIKRKTVGQKAIIYAGTIKMCELITAHLKRRFFGLKISKYTAGDNYETLMTSDITVSTVIKSGTAVDIPNLIAVFNTVMMASMQSNEQVTGRLREIKGVATRYYYFWCGDIRKHKEYNYERLKLLDKMAKTITNENYHKRLR